MPASGRKGWPGSIPSEAQHTEKRAELVRSGLSLDHRMKLPPVIHRVLPSQERQRHGLGAHVNKPMCDRLAGLSEWIDFHAVAGLDRLGDAGERHHPDEHHHLPSLASTRVVTLGHLTLIVGRENQMFAALSLLRPDRAHVQHPAHIVIVHEADERTRWQFDDHWPGSLEVHGGNGVRRVSVRGAELLPRPGGRASSRRPARAFRLRRESLCRH